MSAMIATTRHDINHAATHKLKYNITPTNSIYHISQMTITVVTQTKKYQSPGGLVGCSPSDSGKTSIFRAKVNFSGRSQQPKMKKQIFLYNIKQKRLNSFHLAR